MPATRQQESSAFWTKAAPFSPFREFFNLQPALLVSVSNCFTLPFLDVYLPVYFYMTYGILVCLYIVFLWSKKDLFGRQCSEQVTT